MMGLIAGCHSTVGPKFIVQLWTVIFREFVIFVSCIEQPTEKAMLYLFSKEESALMPHTLILMVGRDRILVETRSQVLRAAGYSVVATFTPRQAIDEFVKGDFDLVLLCHSISGDGRERLVKVLREYTSRTPIISVAAFSGQFDGFADGTIESDPSLLLAGLREVLHRGKDNS